MTTYKRIERNIYKRGRVYCVTVERRPNRYFQRSCATLHGARLFRNKMERLHPRGRPGNPRKYAGDTRSERMKNRYRALRTQEKCVICGAHSKQSQCDDCKAINKLKKGTR